ncbi:MAG: Imm61 family immunity protein [Mycobacterium sp.]
MTAPRISDGLLNFASDAGFSLTTSDVSGAAVFWTDPGGAMRFYVRAAVDFGYTLTSAERALAEQFELFGASMTVIERYLFGVFGSAVRSRHRLPRLILPIKQEELALGYLLHDVDSEGYRSLNDSRGLVAKARGRVSSVSVLIKLSRLLSNSPSAIQSSFEDPEGRPLFAVR